MLIPFLCVIFDLFYSLDHHVTPIIKSLYRLILFLDQLQSLHKSIHF